MQGKPQVTKPGGQVVNEVSQVEPMKPCAPMGQKVKNPALKL